jgi:hypothetical protein
MTPPIDWKQLKLSILFTFRKSVAKITFFFGSTFSKGGKGGFFLKVDNIWRSMVSFSTFL